MKITQYKCDICRNLIEGKRYTLMVVSVDHENEIEPVKPFDTDCCFNCLPEFLKKISPDPLPWALKAPSQEEDAQSDVEPEEEKKDPEPPAKRGGGRRALDFDIGKATSLWRGGWKLSKIADEMHCAPQTVANYLERAGVIKKKENVNASNTADV